MDVIIIGSDALEELKKEFRNDVKAAVKEILAEHNLAQHTDWITWEQAKKILPYKSKTS